MGACIGAAGSRQATLAHRAHLLAPRLHDIIAREQLQTLLGCGGSGGGGGGSGGRLQVGLQRQQAIGAKA